MPASSALLRACFVGASAAVHVVAFATFGHAPPSGRLEMPRADDIVVAELVPPIDDPATDPGGDAVNRRPFGALPTHRRSVPVAPDHDARPHGARLPFAAPLALRDESPPVEAVASPARFTMVVGASPVHAQGRASSQGAASEPAADDKGPLSEDDVSSPAHPVGLIAPAYPPEARALTVEADVVLAIVVTAAGTVAEARVERRAGFGFDEAVLAAVRAAHFVAATQDGRPVAVRMRLAYSFRLQ